MRGPEPPGWPWLLAFELRLLWRAFGVRSWTMAALACFFVALLHLAGWFFWRTAALPHALVAAPAALASMTVFALLLMLSSAFALAVRTLFERADLDLLLSAPVPIVHVFVTRGIAVAAGAVAPVALFVLPFADMGPTAGHWGALAAWPALFAMGLACAALAFAGTLALVRLLGVRRARVASQVLGAFLGAALVLGMQLQSLLPRGARAALERAMASAAHGGVLGPQGPLLWPLRAMLGEPWPLLGVIAASVALFVVVARSTARGFVRVVQEAPAAAVPRVARRGAGHPAFRQGLARIVVRKELLLMARDPMLIGKSLLQVLYLVPMFVIMLRSRQPLDALAAALVLLSASIAATLGWISVSGEEAPELLATAPVPIGRLRRLKVMGAVLPVAALTLPFIAWYAWKSPAMAVVVAAYVATAMACSAMVQVWGTPLGAGRDPKVRRSQNIALRIVDNLASFGWAGACYATLRGSPWALAGIAIGLLGPGAAAIAARLREDAPG